MDTNRGKMKADVSDNLESIPGVGVKIAQHMRDIGINSVSDIKGQNAERLYQKLCDFKALPVDRCMLYVFRSSIYYTDNLGCACTGPPRFTGDFTGNPELLNWWNWKDKN